MTIIVTHADGSLTLIKSNGSAEKFGLTDIEKVIRENCAIYIPRLANLGADRRRYGIVETMISIHSADLKLEKNTDDPSFEESFKLAEIDAAYHESNKSMGSRSRTPSRSPLSRASGDKNKRSTTPIGSPSQAFRDFTANFYKEARTGGGEGAPSSHSDASPREVFATPVGSPPSGASANKDRRAKTPIGSPKVASAGGGEGAPSTHSDTSPRETSATPVGSPPAMSPPATTTRANDSHRVHISLKGLINGPKSPTQVK